MVFTRHVPVAATTHVVNKILTIIWYMLINNNLYDDRNENRYRAKRRA